MGNVPHVCECLVALGHVMGGRQSSWAWGSWILGLVWREIKPRPGDRSSGLEAMTGRQLVPSAPALPCVGDAVP